MTTECYFQHCPFHGVHDDEEGPFCFEPHCRATPVELRLHEIIRRMEKEHHELGDRLIDVIKGLNNKYEPDILAAMRAAELMSVLEDSIDLINNGLSRLETAVAETKQTLAKTEQKVDSFNRSIQEKQ